MMMRHACKAGLAALLLMVGMVEAEANSNKDFPCQIDLREREGGTAEGAFRIDGIPDDFRKTYGSSKQLKVCQGKNNVRVSCDALVPDWPFKQNLTTADLTCCINTAPCGIANSDGEECGNLTEAEEASLRIVSTRSSLCGPDSSSCGFAKLECRLK